MLLFYVKPSYVPLKSQTRKAKLKDKIFKQHLLDLFVPQITRYKDTRFCLDTKCKIYVNYCLLFRCVYIYHYIGQCVFCLLSMHSPVCATAHSTAIFRTLFHIRFISKSFFHNHSLCNKILNEQVWRICDPFPKINARNFKATLQLQLFSF